MAEHTELIETILPLIFGIVLPLIGGAMAGGYVMIKRVLRNTGDFINTLNKALEDDNLTSPEVKELIAKLLALIRNDPEASKALLNAKA